MLKFLKSFFAYQGKTRTKPDNIVSAISLSCVAGIVNIVGFLTVYELSTNVTGHFAFMIYEFNEYEIWKGFSYSFYIFSFLSGSIVSSLLLNFFRTSEKINVYAIPILIEITLLSIVLIYYSNFYVKGFSDFIITVILLFSMGMQNAYITKISNSVVRTTHVTGLFTDLGIEIATLLSNKNTKVRKVTKASVYLRIYIITFFFFGGIIAGVFYTFFKLGIKTLNLAIAILVFYLFYDALNFQLKLLKRQINFKKLK